MFGLNMLAKLRQLQGQQQPEEDYPTPYTEEELAGPPEQQSQRSYEEDFPSLSRYRQHLEQMPRREDYDPSFGRRLLTGLAGALGSRGDAGRGLAIQQELAEMPYKKAMQQYQAEGQGLKELSDQETSFGNMMLRDKYNQGRLAQGQEGLELRGKDIASKEADRAADNERAEKKLALDREIAKINEDYKKGLIDQRQKDRSIREAHYKAMEGIGSRRAATAEKNAETYRTTAGKSKEEKPVPVSEQAKAQSSAINIVLKEMPDSFDLTDPTNPKIRESATPQERRAIKSRVDELVQRMLNRKRSDPAVDADGPPSRVYDIAGGLQDPDGEDEEDEDQEDRW